MRRFNVRFVFILILFLSFDCSAMMRHSEDYDIQQRVIEYKNYAFRHLDPFFKRAGLNYPPKHIALLVFKHSRRLELWANDNGPWRHIKNYPILAASGGPGPKLLEGDRQVPEGIYSISELNPNSHFHLSMQVDYPDTFDKAHARLDGRTDLGGEIFIHGSDRSIGCIAIGNENIDQLFVLASEEGIDNIEVIIAPNDLRTEAPIYSKTKHHPSWLPTLYAKIKKALKPFHTTT